MKKVVGIIANTLGFNSDNPFDDKYYVQNSYVKRIKEAGGIPIIIPPINLNLNNDAMEMCDSFLLIGGKDIYKYHFDVVDYALKTKKNLLGICMGMQVMAMYSNNNLDEDYTLYKIDNHYHDNVTHEKPELLVHEISVDESSLLASLIGSKIKVNSIHNYAVKRVLEPFKVVAKSNDVIEALEYNNIIGVQFHPELMKNTDNLFRWLVG